MKVVGLNALISQPDHAGQPGVAENVQVTQRERGRVPTDRPISLVRGVPSPLHAQISDAMRLKIASEEWPEHYRLKPEPELAGELGVSRGTLRRALATLIDEGVLRQVQGKGTFVTSIMIEPAIAQRLSSLSEDFVQLGIVVTTEVQAAKVVEAPGNVAALLDVAKGSKMLELRRVRSAADGPLALLLNYVRTDLAPGIHRHNFTSRTLFGVLENDYHLRLGSGRRTFSAQSASPDVASALHLAVGDPVQYLEQVTYLEDGRPVEYSHVWINSSRLRVTSVLSRKA